MKTFSEYHRADIYPRLALTALTIVGAYFYYQLTKSAVDTAMFALTALAFNFVVGYGRTAWTMYGDALKVKHRMNWEQSMLQTIQLAKEADLYYQEPNLLSAFHNAVDTRRIEGVRAGYLDVGRL